MKGLLAPCTNDSSITFHAKLFLLLLLLLL